MFGYTLYCQDVPGTDHICDAALAIAKNVVQELAGPDWKATEVRLNREQPKEIVPYRRHFGARLRFGTAHSVIVFHAFRRWAGTTSTAWRASHGKG
jgi:hypothetical protein